MKNCDRLFRNLTMAVLNKIQGKLVLVVQLYRKALEIFEETYGTKHIYFSASLNNLVELCLTQGNYIESRFLYMLARRRLELCMARRSRSTAGQSIRKASDSTQSLQRDTQ